MGVLHKQVAELAEIIRVCELNSIEARRLVELSKKIDSTPRRIAIAIALETFPPERISWFKAAAEARRGTSEGRKFQRLAKLGETITDPKNPRAISEEYKSLVEKIRAKKVYFGRKYGDPRVWTL